MKSPAPADDELERIKDLRSLNILDTPSEERFDRLTRMAKRIFDVPIALVSLVDENRQWFKSCIGLEVSETARDISFCGHAILGDQVFIIPDSREDERFLDNPLVLGEPFVRFYAGCPLKLSNNRKMGTLCIIDTKPRNMNKEEIELLEDLACMVESEMAALQIATLDELTRISNLRGFHMLAQKSMEYCRRNKVPACMAYFDLNDFKPINDNFGHAEGDRALSAFADLMRESIRESDIIARLGGDEFAACFLNTSRSGTESVIQKFQQSLNKYNREAKRGYDICFSHGIVEYNPQVHKTINDILADCDALMYENKKSA